MSEEKPKSRKQGRPTLRQFRSLTKHETPIERLRERLEPNLDATHLRNQALHPPKATLIPTTRSTAIKKLNSWAESALTTKSHICFLFGGSRSGKSTLAQHLAATWDKKGKLAGSFFFSGEDPSRKRVAHLASTLAFQLAAVLPEIVPVIESVMAEEPELLSPVVPLTMQLQKLVFRPVKSVIKNLVSIRIKMKGPLIFVIDAIDECHDKDQILDFVDQLVTFFRQTGNFDIPLRFLITGRIEAHMHKIVKAEEIQVVNIDDFNSKEDTKTYLQEMIAKHNESAPVESRVSLSPEGIDNLNSFANGSFSVASGIIQFILGAASDSLTFLTPMECTEIILGSINENPDNFFYHSLSQAKELPYFHDIISTIALLKSPPAVADIARFLGIYCAEVVSILASIPTVVAVPGRDSLPITFLHAGLKEFLLDEDRSGSLHVDKVFLKTVAYRCLDLALSHYESLSEEQLMVPLPPSIEEAITYWPHHLNLVMDADPSFNITALDERYHQILSRFAVVPVFYPIVALVAFSEGPILLGHVTTVLQVPVEDFALIIYGLTPILTRGAGRYTGPLSLATDFLQFRHPSIKEFLLTGARSMELSISPATCTRLSQRYLDIMFGLPQTFVNEKAFFISWARFVALAVSHDPTFDLEWLEGAYNAVTPLRRAIDSALGWKEPYTIVLEPAEIAVTLSNVELAIHAIEARVRDILIVNPLWAYLTLTS